METYFKATAIIWVNILVEVVTGSQMLDIFEGIAKRIF